MRLKIWAWNHQHAILTDLSVEKFVPESCQCQIFEVIEPSNTDPLSFKWQAGVNLYKVQDVWDSFQLFPEAMKTEWIVRCGKRRKSESERSHYLFNEECICRHSHNRRLARLIMLLRQKSLSFCYHNFYFCCVWSFAIANVFLPCRLRQVKRLAAWLSLMWE